MPPPPPPPPFESARELSLHRSTHTQTHQRRRARAPHTHTSATAVNRHTRIGTRKQKGCVSPSKKKNTHQKPFSAASSVRSTNRAAQSPLRQSDHADVVAVPARARRHSAIALLRAPHHLRAPQLARRQGDPRPAQARGRLERQPRVGPAPDRGRRRGRRPHQAGEGAPGEKKQSPSHRAATASGRDAADADAARKTPHANPKNPPRKNPT